MRPIAVAVLISCCSCSAQPDSQSSSAPHREVLVPDHTLPAFGGQLLGTDDGEWIGKLIFQDGAGNLQTLLKENVHGIVQNSSGIFVFTGLAHMRSNEGYIYMVAADRKEKIHTTLLGRLPGAPGQVSQKPDGSTTFLVYSGFSSDRPLYECYSLTGKIVSRAYDCLPPKTGL
jgi:hypothetical protein